MFNFQMKIYSIFVVIFIVDFYGLVSSTLPNVPDTTVISPSGAASPTTLQPSLAIYYDAMEGNSQIFFTKYVKEVAFLSTFVDITLNPCQLAKDSGDDLKCEGVDHECKLDKYHSCAIAKSNDIRQLLHFLACTMTSVDKLPDLSTCTDQNKFDYYQLSTCVLSGEATTLCKNHRAEKLPDTQFLPTFIFKNPNYNQEPDPFENLNVYIDDVYMFDFITAVCAQLIATKATHLPKGCDKRLVIGIFYKAMDNKFQKWFQTFAKVYNKFSKYLTVIFEPCMFAEVSQAGELDCKDAADTKCAAARTHACASSIISDQTLLFQFLNCTMQDATKVPDFEKCATDNKISYEPIKACAESNDGIQLCSDRSNTRPKSDKIPSFSYELTFDEKVSEATSTATDLQPVFYEQMTKYGITKPPDSA